MAELMVPAAVPVLSVLLVLELKLMLMTLFNSWMMEKTGSACFFRLRRLRFGVILNQRLITFCQIEKSGGSGWDDSKTKAMKIKNNVYEYFLFL